MASGLRPGVFGRLKELAGQLLRSPFQLQLQKDAGELSGIGQQAGLTGNNVSNILNGASAQGLWSASCCSKSRKPRVANCVPGAVRTISRFRNAGSPSTCQPSGGT